MSHPAQTSHEMAQYLMPPKNVTALKFCLDHVYTDEPNGGRPYDNSMYPHIGAPGGPCDAVTDRTVQRIWLQWASRLGKSFFGQSMALYLAETYPLPMMLAGPDEKTAKEVTKRTYGMMSNSPLLRSHLKQPSKRRQDRIDFRACPMFVAWARSVSTLADKAVRFGHANEVDKWEHLSTSKEADPLRLFFDRGKQFPTRKFLIESTPTIKGKSRVEHGRLQSSNCKLYVPCPHCGKYQTLRMERLEWDKNEAGKSDKDLARKTARYQCEGCNALLEDHHRAYMMRRGVWCPEGCTVKDAEASALFDSDRPPWQGWTLASWIEGVPSRDGPDAGYQLSSLYALSLGWGDIAAEFVGCKDKPQDLRNFVNQWLAETWEEVRRKATWEHVGVKLIDPSITQRIVPQWASMVTIGVDRQQDGFPWSAEAWGPDRRNATIAYGKADSMDDIEQVVRTMWQHADKGPPVRAAWTLIDSGFRPDGVYEFCLKLMRQGWNVFPSKGSNQSLNADWTQATLGKHTSLPGMVLYHVDTVRTQLWLDHAIHDIPTGEAGSVSIYNASLGEHQDYLEQLINDAPVEDLDSRQNVRENWERINTSTPNDWRDCKRYAYAAMLIATGGRVPNRMAVRQPAPKADDDDGGNFRRLNFRRR